MPPMWGTLREGRFIPLPVDGNDVKNNFYDNPTSVPPLFRSVASDTVAVAGTSVRAESAACIENMEGAGFFAVCGALGVPFAELAAYRIISARSAAVGGLRRRSEGLRRMSGGSSTPCGSGRKELPDGWGRLRDGGTKIQ